MMIKNLVEKILKLYGGMGSFNDLVLYKNGVLCKKENNILDELRNKFYETSKAIISKN